MSSDTCASFSDISQLHSLGVESSVSRKRGSSREERLREGEREAEMKGGGGQASTPQLSAFTTGFQLSRGGPDESYRRSPQGLCKKAALRSIE